MTGVQTCALPIYRVEKVSDALKVGDMVDVKLLDVDFDKKRISLSMKALLNDDAE